MKKVLLMLVIATMICSISVVFADAIGPEFPEPYHYNDIEVSPIIFAVIAIAVVAVSCVISIKVRKSKNNSYNDATIEKGDK